MSSSLPQIVVSDVTRIVNDGAHNAFTDLIRYQGRFYLGYRSHPQGHDITPGAQIVILTSEDGSQWREVVRMPQAGHDPRDVHFLEFKGRLFAYFSSWVPQDRPFDHGYWQHLWGYALHTGDGEHWVGPVTLPGTAEHFIWRAATHGDKAYLCGRRINKQASENKPPESPQQVVIESAMMVSDDGLSWTTQGLFQDIRGNETAFLFEDDGSVVAVCRSQPSAQLCVAKPPYQEWTRTDLGRFIGGPMLARWGERLLVGGRKFVPADDAPARKGTTVLSWLVDGRLHDMVTLPSGGDTSYPGFVPLSDTTGLLSWYSSHEGSGSKHAPSAIYTARLSIA